MVSYVANGVVPDGGEADVGVSFTDGTGVVDISARDRL